jgi:RNA polymerase sigma factor (sigma-70 family)
MSGKHIVPTQYRSEALLVRAAQNGDHRAIEHLLLAHPPIRSLIGSLKRQVDPHGHATEDLEGSARVALLEALRSFRANRGARFTTYAYYYLHGAMLKALYPASERYRHNGVRARVRLVPLEQPSGPEDEHYAGHEQQLLNNDPGYGIDPGYGRVENADRDATVVRFVATLPPSQRQIATAVFWDGQTHGEVAASRGVSRPAVSRTLQRVFARAERDLADHRHQLAA